MHYLFHVTGKSSTLSVATTDAADTRSRSLRVLELALLVAAVVVTRRQALLAQAHVIFTAHSFRQGVFEVTLLSADVVFAGARRPPGLHRHAALTPAVTANSIGLGILELALLLTAVVDADARRCALANAFEAHSLRVRILKLALLVASIVHAG